MNPAGTLVLTRQDVIRLLPLDDCIAAVERAFREVGRGASVRSGVLAAHADAGGFHVKTALLPSGRPVFTAKVNANYPENQARYNLPTIQGVIVLADAENGRPLAIMDSIEITALRTAAATAIAAKYLARPDSRMATIAGCGVQGRVQLRALCRVLPIETAHAWDIAPERAAQFAREMTNELGISVHGADELASAVRASEVCVTCTTAKRWFVARDHVPSGTFVAAVGADNPQKQELEPALVAAAKLVCDSAEQCASIGELHHALDAGVMSRENVYADLAEVIAGRKPGRASADEIIVFDSTGLGFQDAAAAAVVYDHALNSQHAMAVDLAG